jgi:hypothetical protein
VRRHAAPCSAVQGRHGAAQRSAAHAARRIAAAITFTYLLRPVTSLVGSTNLARGVQSASRRSANRQSSRSGPRVPAVVSEQLLGQVACHEVLAVPQVALQDVLHSAVLLDGYSGCVAPVWLADVPSLARLMCPPAWHCRLVARVPAEQVAARRLGEHIQVHRQPGRDEQIVVAAWKCWRACCCYARGCSVLVAPCALRGQRTEAVGTPAYASSAVCDVRSAQSKRNCQSRVVCGALQCLEVRERVAQR